MYSTLSPDKQPDRGQSHAEDDGMARTDASRNCSRCWREDACEPEQVDEAEGDCWQPEVGAGEIVGEVGEDADEAEKAGKTNDERPH